MRKKTEREGKCPCCRADGSVAIVPDSSVMTLTTDNCKGPLFSKRLSDENKKVARLYARAFLPF